MITVHKFKVMDAGGRQQDVVLLPTGAVVRAVGVQDHAVFVWAEVDTSVTTKTPRRIKVYGTGHELPRDTAGRRRGVYLGTVFDGPYVWHVYEEPTA